MKKFLNGIFALCDVVGEWTIIITSFLFHYLLSMDAMRRYARWAVATYRWIDETGSAIGDFTNDLIYYRGRLGVVIFDVEDDARDGYVVLREYGDQRMVPMNFQCMNRWVVRNGSPSGAHLNELMSQATEQFKVAHVVWGERQMMPYQVAPLTLLRRPDDVRLPALRKWMERQPEPRPVHACARDVIQRLT